MISVSSKSIVSIHLPNSVNAHQSRLDHLAWMFHFIYSLLACKVN
ncbi:hypothetical protein T4A_13529 [Trichinella pseudospiralis]|uniref:Uncharacterized protein n=1 Tax=Trichinella pseudospiralis TaxID=6337 RepID=A0A0V1ERP7_TRIPS|nr:hypothetical protein T4A_13529 [Trichinella pseudospiralis]